LLICRELLNGYLRYSCFPKEKRTRDSDPKNEIELIGQRLRKAKDRQINLLLEERGLKQREAAELHSF
jgi:hypothetical protein